MYASQSSLHHRLLTSAMVDGKQSCELLQSLKTVNLPLIPKGTPFAKPGLRFESYEGLTHSLGDKVGPGDRWLDCLSDDLD
jgi:hypothetical protein